MDAVVSFFKGIGEAIIAAFEFLISFFQDLLYAIQLLGRVLASIPGYLSWLPDPMLVLLLTLFSIVVIYKILGREG